MTRLEPRFEETLRRYLLGTLDETARLDLEGRLIQDPAAFDALGVVEDELTEEYLDETLSETDRRRFERRACALEHHSLPGFFGALRDRAAIPEVEPATERRWNLADWFRPAAPQPAWLAAAAAALVLSLAANAWLGWRQTSLEAQVARMEAEAPASAPLAAPVATPASRPRLAELTAANRDLETRLEAERQQRALAETRVAELERAARKATSPTPTFVLAAGLLRGTGALTRVAVPTHAEVVRVLLELPSDDHALYRAVLHDVDGEEMWAQSQLSAAESEGRLQVAVLLPASLLPRGDYQLGLSGVTQDGEREPLASYTFRVTGD